MKYAFVTVFQVLFSFCSHVPKKLMAIFPCSRKPLGETQRETFATRKVSGFKHTRNGCVLVRNFTILLYLPHIQQKFTKFNIPDWFSKNIPALTQNSTQLPVQCQVTLSLSLCFCRSVMHHSSAPSARQ